MRLMNISGMIILTFFCSFAYTEAADVRDSLILKNGNVIVGEIKEMDMGVLQIETPYSDSDFKIEWDGVKEIYSQSVMLIELEHGGRHTGTLTFSDSGKIWIKEDNGALYTVDRSEIISLMELESGFLSRLKANIDVGYSLTKAKTQQQLTVNSRVAYLAENWKADIYFNDLASSQDSTESIRRTDYGLGYRYLLPLDWYASADLTFLSNTEQSIKRRTNIKLGGGNYFFRTNKALWGFGGGVSANLEQFTNDSADRQSLELFFGTDINLFDVGDLNFLTSAYAYPSMTDGGRWRSDVRLDVKYDLPLDFYIRAGVTVNYDNRPAEAGSELDYVFTTGFGWEW